jgi:AcrR family transcriptional regulator
LTPRERLLATAIEFFAEHGIGDLSLRAVAAELGTSHRMLIYHFGSKEGLLAEVVRAVEHQQRDALETLMADDDLPPIEQSLRFWHRVADAAVVYGRLFFELSALALHDKPHTAALKQDLVGVWLEPLTELWIRLGIPAAEAATYARLGLGAARGLLLDLLATGDRAAVDDAAALLNRLFAVQAQTD